MKFKLLIGVLIIAGIGGLLFAKSQTPPLHNEQEHPAHAVTVYKTPTCGCCGVYVNYLRTKNYTVDVVDLEDSELAAKKEAWGVPAELSSCHTTIVQNGDYFVEGHIPFEAVSQLLDDQPAIAGIGMPGMPTGSPGMPGSQSEPFNISQVKADDTVAPYLTL